MGTEEKSMQSDPTKPCRTFPTRDQEPVSIATQIERCESLITPIQLALFLALSPKTIYAMAKAGTLPTVRLGASIRFCPTTTAKWLRDRSA